MHVIFMAHSGIGYLALLIGVMVAVYAGIQMVRGKPYNETARRFGVSFAGIMDIQLLLGIANLVTRPFYPQLIGHIALMVLAVALAHVPPALNKRRPPEARSLGLQLGATLGVLALIVGGILAIGRSIL
jgi:heme A synthase